MNKIKNLDSTEKLELNKKSSVTKKED